nr:hypothetical protein CFP56_20431 [Quercus suber]
MGAKRRRERDRPKASGDVPYNPNKRVLLSYDSAEEQVEDEALEQLPPGHPQAETDLADYKIVEYGDDDEEEEHRDELPYSVGSQRKSQKKAYAARGVDTHKNEAKDSKSKWNRPVLRNEATGQWPALGSLRYQWDEEHDEENVYEDDEQHASSDEEAMAYLRAVRSERQKMPEVFTSVARDEEDDIYWKGLDDLRGYVDDGAYVGRAPVSSDNPRTFLDPQDAFTTALKKQFLAVRQQLQQVAKPDEVKSRCKDLPTSFYQGSNKSYAEWLRALKTTTPIVAQVKLLSQESVFGLLALVQKHFLVRGNEISANTGVWIWSLLARLHDAGNMNNDQVYHVREFGKDAMLVQISFYNPAAAAQLDGGDDEKEQGEMSRHVENNANLTTTKGEVAPDSAEIELDLNDTDDNIAEDTIKLETDLPGKQYTLATLEMILAIVGDVFGQRDLLDFRRSWEADANVKAV